MRLDNVEPAESQLRNTTTPFLVVDILQKFAWGVCDRERAQS